MDLLTANQDSDRAIAMAISLVALSLCGLIALAWAGYTSLVKVAFPVTTVVIGIWLYASHTAFYLSYTWWIWFITPFVRRLVDYELGWHDPRSLVMVAPLGVTGIALITVIQKGRLLSGNRTYFPLFLALIGLAYGYLVGLVRVGIVGATLDLLQWILPIVFCFHILISWHLYPDFRKVIRTTFTWALILIGGYAVVQYLVAPPWDMYWMVESGMTSSMGHPYPGQFRVFGTLNATGPFARIMMAGLLLMLEGKGFLPLFASAPGYLSIAFSNVRAAWGAWFVGLIYLVIRLRGKLRSRLIRVLAIASVLAIPLFIYMPDTGRVVERAQGLSTIQEDGSFQARLSLHITHAPRILSNPVGTGIGAFGRAAKFNDDISGFMDSGFLELPLTLGWIGSFFYLTGLIWMTVRVVRLTAQTADPFAVVATSIGLAFLSMMLFNIQVKGLGGMAIWMFFGLAYASYIYHDRTPHGP